MSQLLVDIGNTRLKWGVVQDDRVSYGPPIVHARIGAEALIDCWQPITPPDCLAISCVGSKQVLELVRSAARVLWPKTEIILAISEANAFGVVNAYEQPQKLGVDRWLGLIAARHHYPGRVCIVDCGTAITIDLMDQDGMHQGGFISPGLTLMKKSLAQGTDALPFGTENYPMGPANFTEAAIHNGTLGAAIGLIEHVLRGQPEDTSLILTGGDAGSIAGHLARRPIIDHHLVLRGLAVMLVGRR